MTHQLSIFSLSRDLVDAARCFARNPWSTTDAQAKLLLKYGRGAYDLHRALWVLLEVADGCKIHDMAEGRKHAETLDGRSSDSQGDLSKDEA